MLAFTSPHQKLEPCPKAQSQRSGEAVTGGVPVLGWSHRGLSRDSLAHPVVPPARAAVDSDLEVFRNVVSDLQNGQDRLEYVALVVEHHVMARDESEVPVRVEAVLNSERVREGDVVAVADPGITQAERTVDPPLATQPELGGELAADVERLRELTGDHQATGVEGQLVVEPADVGTLGVDRLAFQLLHPRLKRRCHIGGVTSVRVRRDPAPAAEPECHLLPLRGAGDVEGL